MSDSVEVENPTLGKLKLSGQTALLLLALVAAAAAGFGVYLQFEHEAQASVREQTLAKALEKVAGAMEEQAKATRENGCIILYRQANSNPRETLDLCKQVTR